jgi:hypothetical protein
VRENVQKGIFSKKLPEKSPFSELFGTGIIENSSLGRRSQDEGPPTPGVVAV